ncbi:hypothetical protein GF312_03865 [Candidatus Poribacteria bacterium]|nr:hypothetical protein [Candidatus Poribacteria bacterium]
MSKNTRPEIDFYDGFKRADSFQKLVTAGDLGGTKERLVLYGQDAENNLEKLVRVNWFGKDVESVPKMFMEYDEILKENNIKQPEEAVLGCAGPIEDGGKYCNFTNIGLEISTDKLAEIGIKAELINDFFANAVQIPWVKDDDKKEIKHKYEPKEIRPDDTKTMAVLGPGTGLGVAPIYWDKDKGYYPKPSEGGHKAWTPRNELEWYLFRYIKKEADGRDPDVETVASGKGLMNIVNFMFYGKLPKKKKRKKVKKIKEFRKDKDAAEFVKELNKEDPQVAGRLIISAYKDKLYRPVLKYAINIFIDATAVAARDVVHDFCAYNGVYISGGNARRLKKKFLSGRFMKIFDESYEHTDKLRATPVYLVTSKTLGTDGAARYAFSR